jgi:hypothetical protein
MLLWKKISKDDVWCGIFATELRKKIVRVRQEKPRSFLLNAKVGTFRRYRQCLQQH